MRMCIHMYMCMRMFVCVYVCNCDNGFLCRNFQLPLLHFMGSLGFCSLEELQFSHLGLSILGMFVQACPPTPFPCSPWGLWLWHRTTLRSFIGISVFVHIFFISFEIELCVSSFNAEPCDIYANGVLIGGGRRERRFGYHELLLYNTKNLLKSMWCERIWKLMRHKIHLIKFISPFYTRYPYGRRVL